MRFFVYPYKMESNSARMIADGLSCNRIKSDTQVKFNSQDVIVNWGNTNHLDTESGILLNTPACVAIATNKKYAFETFKKAGVSHVPFSVHKFDAQDWSNEGRTVIARKTLTGHSGNGIEIIEPGTQDITDALLYTLYIPKKYEYRIHIFLGEVIDVQIKLRKTGAKEDPNYSPKIRSHHHGWIFTRNTEITVPQEAIEQAIKAVGSLGLEFGAVDIIYNEKSNKVFVLEVNTAPGIEGETMFSYVCSFLSFAESL